MVGKDTIAGGVCGALIDGGGSVRGADGSYDPTSGDEAARYGAPGEDHG